MSSSSQNPDRDAYIAGLRELADWLEKNPDAATPYSGDILVAVTTNANVEEHAAKTGVDVCHDTDGNATAETQFGAVAYRVYGYADWDQHHAQWQEDRARTWADKHGMVIEPREGGAS